MEGKKPVIRQILASNLKKHRKSLGLSQEKLAEIAGLSWQTINSIECCRTWVSDLTLNSLADALKIETFQLLIPVENNEQKSISPDEALKKLLKLKRAYDDSFNELINMTRKG